MKKILVIGAGAMGSAFTVPCVDNQNNVVLSGTHLENKAIDQIIANDNLHPALKCKLSKNLKIIKFNNFSDEFKEKPDLIVIAVNSKGIDWVGNEISKYYSEEIPILLITKGLTVLNNQFVTLAEKLKKIFEKYFKISEIKNLGELVKSEFNFFLMSFEIQKGFIVKSFYEHRIIFISENDLFGQNSFYKTKKKVNAENFIFEISQLSVKDLVVHSEHGIGMFNGLKNIDINQIRELITNLNKSSFNNKERFIIFDNIEDPLMIPSPLDKSTIPLDLIVESIT